VGHGAGPAGALAVAGLAAAGGVVADVAAGVAPGVLVTVTVGDGAAVAPPPLQAVISAAMQMSAAPVITLAAVVAGAVIAVSF
jgi:hypothetical protein